MANTEPINTEQWDANSVVLIQSRFSKIHRQWVFKRSRFHQLVTNKDAKILDVGCGSGPYLIYFASQGFKNLYGIEPDAELVKNIPPKLRAEVKVCRAEEIGFSDNTFDVVFVYAVLHHLKGTAAYEATCREIYRVLKPGGYVFIMEPGRYKVFRMVEVCSKILGVFLKTFKTFSEVLEEEKPELHYFLKNHHVIRDYFTGNNCKILADKYFIYTWIFTAQKPGDAPH